MLRMLLIAMVLLLGARAEADSISVCTTTTTLGSLVQEIGGEDVTVTAFAKGTEDAHFVDPRPSFVKKLYRADLLVLNGLEIDATVDEQERIILDLASGQVTREELTDWVREHVTDMSNE